MKLYILSFSLLLAGAIFADMKAQQEEHRLDSLIVYNLNANSYKEEIIYDIKGNKILAVGYDRESSGWEKNKETSYSYDTGNRLIKEVYFGLDINKNLMPLKQYSYVYDTNGYYVSEEFLSKNPNSGDWIEGYKYVYAYTSEKIREVTKQVLDNNNWSDAERYVYDYDATGNQTLSEFYIFSEKFNGWTPESKYEKEFDSNNNLKSVVYSAGSDLTLDWNLKTKTDYVYSGNNLNEVIEYESKDGSNWIEKTKAAYNYSGNLIQSITYSVRNNSFWENLSKDTYTYNSNKLTKIVSELWNVEKNKWELYKDREYLYPPNTTDISNYYYDISGNKKGLSRKIEIIENNLPVSVSSYSWNQEANTWYITNEERYTYNASSKIQSVEKIVGKEGNFATYYKTNYNYFPNNDLQKEEIFVVNPDNDQLENIQTIVYYNNGYVTIKNEHEINSNIIVIHNNDLIRLVTDWELSSVSVFSVAGSLVYKGKETEIPTNDWVKGTYIVGVKSVDGLSQSVKIIVR